MCNEHYDLLQDHWYTAPRLLSSYGRDEKLVVWAVSCLHNHWRHFKAPVMAFLPVLSMLLKAWMMPAHLWDSEALWFVRLCPGDINPSSMAHRNFLQSSTMPLAQHAEHTVVCSAISNPWNFCRPFRVESRLSVLWTLRVWNKFIRRRPRHDIWTLTLWWVEERMDVWLFRSHWKCC